MLQTRVVLLDDEPGVLLALKLLMQALSFTVFDFNAPSLALDFIRKNESFDLVLCDLKMPDLNGIQVLEKIRKLSSTVPFILMSGHARAADVALAMQKGASGFLPKPFSPEQLEDLLVSLGIRRTQLVA